MAIHNIINDVFLSNFDDKRRGHAILVNADKVNLWTNRLRKFDYENDIDYARVHDGTPFPKFIPSDKYFLDEMTNRYSVILNIIELGQGKISLCGGAVLSMIRDEHPRDFDLFFHCDSVQEAEDLFNECLDLFKDNEDVYYTRSLGCFSIEFDDLKIQFIKRVYKTKDQVLLGFDLAGCRYGWNHIDGFFTTICGGIAFALQAFPIDLTQRSFSHGRRLSKYNEKFAILLPGYPDDVTSLETPDGFFYGSDRNKYFSLSNFVYNVDYGDDPHANLSTILSNKYQNFVFTSYNFDDIIDLSGDCITTSFFESNIFQSRDPTNGFNKILHKFPTSGDDNKTQKVLGDLWESFVTTYYLKRDINGAQRIWDQALDGHLETAKKIAIMVKENPWRYENPGGQDLQFFPPGVYITLLGKMNPIIANPRRDGTVPIINQ